MKYSEFDRKFNKRICGKIETCSIIDEDGTVYVQGTVPEVEDWWDTHTSPIWEENKINGKYHYEGSEINGKRVMMTNLGESLFKEIEPYLKF